MTLITTGKRKIKLFSITGKNHLKQQSFLRKVYYGLVYELEEVQILYPSTLIARWSNWNSKIKILRVFPKSSFRP